MAPSPVIPLMVIVCVLGFEAALFGGQVITSAFPEFLHVSFIDCSDAKAPAFVPDALAIIGCWIGQVVKSIINIFLFLYGVISLVFSLVTFNVPGAPAAVRAVVGVLMVSMSGWSIATLVRGN